MSKIIVSKNQFLQTYKSHYYTEKANIKYNNIFPLKLQPSLVYVVGSLMTDGFIDIRPYYKTLKYSYIGYFSKYTNQLEIFHKNFYNLFQIKGEIKNWGVRAFGKSKGYIVNSSIPSRILSLCGVPGGDKTVHLYCLPKWILTSDQLYKKLFLRRIFSCEGSIEKDSFAIRYSMFKLDSLSYSTINFLNDIRSILLSFDVITTKPYIAQQYIRKKIASSLLVML